MTTGTTEATEATEVIQVDNNTGIEVTHVRNDTSMPAEAVIWNNTKQNVSIGLALLEGDQLHVDIRRTCDIPKDTPKDILDKFCVIKPEEGRIYKLLPIDDAPASKETEAEIKA